MEDKLKDILVSIGLMVIGVYARVYFGGRKFSVGQVIALIGVGGALILILNKINIGDVYKMSITLFYGLASPNIISAVIKAAQRSEEKAAKKLQDYIDKKTDL